MNNKLIADYRRALVVLSNGLLRARNEQYSDKAIHRIIYNIERITNEIKKLKRN